MKTPMQYNIYKGKGGKWGALQLKLIPPYFVDSNRNRIYPSKDQPINFKEVTQCPGFVFLETTSPSAPDKYDWTQKIKMALSVEDLSILLFALRTGETKNIFHDPNMNTAKQGQTSKSIEVSSPKGLSNGCMWRTTMKSNGESVQHTVPLTPNEIIILRELFQAAIPAIFDW